MQRTSPGGSTTPTTPFLFIVGCGRSGTTLLRAILDSHSALAIPAETKFILSMATRRARYESENGLRVRRFVKDLWAFTYIADRMGLSLEEVREDFTTNVPSSYPDAVRRLFALHAARAGKPRYGNKTPVHVLSLGKIIELFPEARIVHIIRDGRDVALSYLDVDFGPTTIEGAALRWRRYVSAGRRSGLRLGPASYHELRYEHLVDQPEQVLRALCGFLGVEFEKEMLRFFERADEVRSGIALPQYHGGLSQPLTRGMRDWRAQMSPSKVARFESLAGDVLDELGYERATPSPGLASRVGARSFAAMSELVRTAGGPWRRLTRIMLARRIAERNRARLAGRVQERI